MCMNEFIKMPDQCLGTQVPQKITDDWVHHWRGNTIHLQCHAIHISGCHLCFTCEHSYYAYTKLLFKTHVATISVSHVKVTLHIRALNNYAECYKVCEPWIVWTSCRTDKTGGKACLITTQNVEVYDRLIQRLLE